MSFDAQSIASAIHARLPDAYIEIEDLRADGTYYNVTVTDKAFTGHSRVDQHRLVFSALGNLLTDEMRERGYALSLRTIPI